MHVLFTESCLRSESECGRDFLLFLVSAVQFVFFFFFFIIYLGYNVHVKSFYFGILKRPNQAQISFLEGVVSLRMPL